MIDFAKITIKAGDGGRGAGTFTHIKGKRYGKADGGNGGRGGDVYFEASRDLNTLEQFRFIKDYSAKDGKNGFSNHRRGADGEDLVIKVPLGTLVKVENPDQEAGRQSGEPEDQLSTFEFDLVSEGEKLLAARGGNGGRGNSHLRDEYGRRPRSGEPGGAGEAYNLILELKLIADVGLIGLPNAGKSTLLTKLTNAQVKIANYPFTTLEPNLGVMKVENSQLVLADIPGLIEGASKGKGLGDLFLRHIERTKMLVHLVDVSKVSSVSNVSKAEGLWRDYQVIRSELKSYSKELAKKKEIVVLNKADLLGEEQIKAAVAEFKKHRKKIFLISADFGRGVDQLVSEIRKRAQNSSVEFF